MAPDVRLDVVDRADRLRCQHRFGRAGRDDASVTQQDQVAAEPGGKVQVVRADDDGGAAVTVQPVQQVSH